MLVARKQIWTGIVASTVMMVLILDARTALSGAQAGLELCIRTVIPSLFPFIVISTVINSNITGFRISVLRPVGYICGIPRGAESLLLLGVLGGYPVGAQGVAEAYKSNRISKEDAQRLLGFCNNAGPAFIFGMLSSLFDKPSAVWVLWGIHIASAILVGIILPHKSTAHCQLSQESRLTIAQAMEKGAKTMGIICAWIIMFRILIVFLQQWILWLFPVQAQIWMVALLELSNGCSALYGIQSQGVCFVVCAGALAFGGACVYLQTLSVTNQLQSGMYFPGKVLQSCISILTAIVAQQFMFPASERHPAPIWFVVALLIITVLTIKVLYRQKSCRFLAPSCV